jgi:hypothetical protein
VLSKIAVSGWASAAGPGDVILRLRSLALRVLFNEAFLIPLELEVARRMSDRAGSSLALCGTRLDMNITTVRHFLHWLDRARRTVVSLHCR